MIKVWILLLCAAVALSLAQTTAQPLATFTGAVKTIDGKTLTLSRPDQDDLEIACTHKTHYFSGDRKIKRENIKPGDRVAVETELDLALRPQAVNVRVLPVEKP